MFRVVLALQVRRHIHRLHGLSLSELMNGPIRKKLGIIPQNVTWGGGVSQTWTMSIHLHRLKLLVAYLTSLCFQVRLKMFSVTWQETS